MQLNLPNLSFARLRFTLEALQTLYLPEYKGSTLRGGFGHSFRKVVCTMGPIPCQTCLLHLKCPYPQFFETPVVGEPPRFMRGVKTGPQPFVVEPPLEKTRVYDTGQQLQFGLVLIGRAVEYLPYFIYTFDQLGTMGIGRGKGKFKLTEVVSYNGDWQQIYNGTNKILTNAASTMDAKSFNDEEQTAKALTLKFVTPVRLKSRGQLTMDISFREIVWHLLRRVSILAYFHMPDPQIDWDWRTALNAADEIEIERENLRWQDWQRYSNRQQTRMKLGGFVGEVRIKGNLTPWLPLLRLGESVHFGKGCTFGLGQYNLQVENAPLIPPSGRD